jgi:hypothetical protein
MKCFIITKADPRRFKCLQVVRAYNYRAHFACHTDEQADSLVRAGVLPAQITVTGVEQSIHGVSLQRDFVAKHLMPRGEWCLWMDDNVYAITGLRPDLAMTDSLDLKSRTDWRAQFDRVLTPKYLDWHLTETIKRAEAAGTIFASFANESNILFRRNHWQAHGYCRTRFALYRNDGSGWVPFPTMMLEDLAKSVDVVCRYGSIVVNRYVRSMKEMFEVGGIGTFKERLPWLRDNCKKLLEMYPGLLKYVGDGKMYGVEADDYHLTFAKRSKGTIDRWRKEHGYL